MKNLVRYLLSDPIGSPADGRSIGIGLSAALKKQQSADDAELHVREWATQQDLRKSSQR